MKFKSPELSNKGLDSYKSRVERGLKPIISCIIDEQNIDKQTEKTLDYIEKNGLFVNYGGDINFFKNNKLKNAGETTYVISESNDKPKYSKRFWNCTGIVVVGENPIDGNQVSFMSHQDPWEFLYDSKEKFILDLKQSISNLKGISKKNSIDVAIFGGKDGNYEYEKSIKLLNEIISKELKIEPNIVTGPSIDKSHPTRVYFDTQNRRLYLLRGFQTNHKANENYFSGQFEEKSNDWR